MTRWRVNRAWLSALDEYRWIAETDDGDWHEFETWRKAQDFADTMARTVEVPLPREHIFTVTGSPHIFITDDRQAHQETLITGNGMYAQIDCSQVLPLALALLAHHHRAHTPQPTQH